MGIEESGRCGIGGSSQGQALSPQRPHQGAIMIVLGIVLLLIGFFIGVPILWTIGIIVLIVGAGLAVLGATNHAIGGRSHYF